LDFLFQFVKQNGPNYSFGGYDPGTYGNQPVWLLDRWQNTQTTATYQKFNSNSSIANSSGDAISSTAGFGDASYIRLKNASVSWSIPTKWIEKVKIKSAKIFILGQNLLTFTHYKGLDPESLSSTTLPPLRVISFGVQTTF